MITMYERTMWYSSVCSSVQDHIIKFWLKGQVFGSDTSSFEHKESIMVLKKSIRNFCRLRRWSKGRSKENQSSDQKMSWRLWWEQVCWIQTLKEISFDDVSSLGHSHQFYLLLMEGRFQAMIVLFIFFWPRVKTTKELQQKIKCNESLHKK